MAPNIYEDAKYFVDDYYNTFSVDRAGVQRLYRSDATLFFEGEQVAGPANIVKKLQSLPFAKIYHRLTTLDVLPASKTDGSLLVSVTGGLVADDSPVPIHFYEVFQLIPDGSRYYIFNDIFRIDNQ